MILYATATNVNRPRCAAAVDLFWTHVSVVAAAARAEDAAANQLVGVQLVLILKSENTSLSLTIPIQEARADNVLVLLAEPLASLEKKRPDKEELPEAAA